MVHLHVPHRRARPGNRLLNRRCVWNLNGFPVTIINTLLEQVQTSHLLGDANMTRRARIIFDLDVMSADVVENVRVIVI